MCRFRMLLSFLRWLQIYSWNFKKRNWIPRIVLKACDRCNLVIFFNLWLVWGRFVFFLGSLCSNCIGGLYPNRLPTSLVRCSGDFFQPSVVVGEIWFFLARFARIWMGIRPEQTSNFVGALFLWFCWWLALLDGNSNCNGLLTLLVILWAPVE